MKVECINIDGISDRFTLGGIYEYRRYDVFNWAGGIPESDAIIKDNFGEEMIFIKPFYNGRFRVLTEDELRIIAIDKILKDKRV
jgi:hypothetical protein